MRKLFFWVSAVVLTTVALTASAQDKFQLEEATIAAVHQAMQQHQLTCVQLVNMYLQRIKQYNLALNRGAPINAFVAINPSIFEEARALDASYVQTGKFVGPLHCIPFVIKDNINTIDTPTTAGTLALLGSQPNQDAFLVKQLHAAGAIVLGKGAMDELASGLSGISSRSGRVGNAYDPTKNPGGSSSGVAAAVSANFAMAGIGTDNSGSVRIPAIFNGLYGLRSSTGLISQTGIFPGGNLDGVAGPITRTVEDLATVLTVIAKADPQDIKTSNIPRETSYLPYLQVNALQNKRIGVIKTVGGVDVYQNTPANIATIYQAAFSQLKNQGVTLIDINLPDFNSDRKNNMAGGIEDINNYLAAFPSTRKNASDICNSDRTRVFGNVKECLQFINGIAKKNSSAYQATLVMFAKNRQYVTEVMQKNNLDALIMPDGTATYDDKAVKTWSLPISSNTGLPSITLIAGYTADKIKMPVGIELIGKIYAEPQLIAMAYSYEKNTPARLVPNLGLASQQLNNFSIPQLNNLFTQLGYNTYMQVLQNEPKTALTPQIFSDIVGKTINH